MSEMGDHVLWHAFEAPGCVSLWDGGYMKTFAFHGPDTTASSEEERLQRCERLSALFQQYGESWSWMVEEQNVEVKGYPETTWPTRASALLDAERRHTVTRAGSQYEMRHWLTLVQSAPSRLGAAATTLLTAGEQRTARDRQRDEFLKACDEFQRHLRGIFQIAELTDDEMATYLKSTVSTVRQKVCADDHELLGVSLADQRFTRGYGVSRLGEDYIAVCTLGSFPKTSHPQLIANLSKLPFEFRHTTRWVCMDRAQAKTLMIRREEKALGSSELAKDQFLKLIEFMSKKPGGDQAYQRRDREQVKRADEAGDAMTRLGTRGFGNLTTTFVVWDRDAARCVQKRAQLKEKVQSTGLIIRDESLEALVPWRQSLPGSREMKRCTFTVSTRNLADIMPTNSVWQGRACDVDLAARTGVSRPWMYTADPVPMRVNTDVPGGAAHCCLFGRTGQAGKSTLSNHLGMQYLGWPRAQVISISVGRSELGPCLLNGGAVYQIGDPESPSAFQPLSRADEPGPALEALEWLQLCLESVGETVTPARTQALSEQLELMAKTPVKLRTMTEFARRLKTRDPELRVALLPYTLAGRYGHIFDGDNADALAWRRWTMFDVSKLIGMSSKAAVPALAHLLNLVRSRFDGRPTLVALDEAQEWLHFEQLQTFVRKVLNTTRKLAVRALIVTLSPAEFAEHEALLATIRTGCVTKIFGPDDSVKTNAAHYTGMGVTEAEMELIQKMPLGSYLLRNQFGSREFALNAGPIALKLTGLSSPEELAMIEELHRTSADENEMLDKLLKRTKLSAAAAAAKLEVSPWKKHSEDAPDSGRVLSPVEV